MAEQQITLRTTVADQNVVLFIPKTSGYSVRVQPMDAGSRTIRVERATAAPTQLVFRTVLPTGSRWLDLGGERIALLSADNQRLLTLATSYRTSVGFDLNHVGNDLAATFTATTAGRVPTVGEILAPFKRPAGGNGCTTAPGNTGAAHNCIVLEGDGATVTSAVSNYYFVHPVGDAVCNRNHQFLYTEATGRVVTKTVSPPGCINPLAMVGTGDYVTLPNTPLLLKPDTMFCTRAKNSATGGEWTPWACMNIEK